MVIEYTVENAIKILKFLDFEIEQDLREHFNDWYSYYRDKRKDKSYFEVDYSDLERLGILREDFEFMVDIAFAYSITYGNHSKNRDKKYISSKKSEVIMGRAATSGLWQLLHDKVNIDDLGKFCNQNPHEN